MTISFFQQFARPATLLGISLGAVVLTAGCTTGEMQAWTGAPKAESQAAAYHDSNGRIGPNGPALDRSSDTQFRQ